MRQDVEEIRCACGDEPVTATLESVPPDHFRLRPARCGHCGRQNQLPARAVEWRALRAVGPGESIDGVPVTFFAPRA